MMSNVVQEDKTQILIKGVLVLLSSKIVLNHPTGLQLENIPFDNNNNEFNE